MTASGIESATFRFVAQCATALVEALRVSFFYGCETWSLTLREESRLRLFENRKLRRFGPSRYVLAGEWRKLHNEELNDLYCSPNIFQAIKIRWVGHVARMGERKVVYRFLD
jgi:hypothetical protein